MNAKRVSDALSELGPQYVQEALQYKGRSKALRWRKWGAAAACLVVVVALVLGGTSIFARDSLPQLQPAAPAAEPSRGAVVAAVSAALAEELGTDVSAIRILSLQKVA